MNDMIGLRIELTENLDSLTAAGMRGVIAESRGHIGVVLDGRPGELVIVHDFHPILNYVRIIEDERTPEPRQLSLFGEE